MHGPHVGISRASTIATTGHRGERQHDHVVVRVADARDVELRDLAARLIPMLPAIVEIEAIAHRLRVGHPVADDAGLGAILHRQRDERGARVVVPSVSPAERG